MPKAPLLMFNLKGPEPTPDGADDVRPFPAFAVPARAANGWVGTDAPSKKAVADVLKEIGADVPADEPADPPADVPADEPDTKSTKKGS